MDKKLCKHDFHLETCPVCNETDSSESHLNALLNAFKVYTDNKKMPYSMMAFFNDGSGQILEGENIIAHFDDIDELSQILGI